MYTIIAYFCLLIVSFISPFIKNQEVYYKAEATVPSAYKQWYKQNYSKIKLLGVILPLIPTYLKYKMVKNTSSDTINKMRLKAVLVFNKLLAGMTEEEIKRFFSFSSAAIKSQLNPAVVEKAKKARQEGYHTVLLSGAYLLLLNNIKDFLDFDTVISSEIYFDQGYFIIIKLLILLPIPLRWISLRHILSTRI